ncbi:MAG TPA: molybdenum cofactor guanylyltransferase [Longimicrobium sp.]|nr:molybdenum cofactor guanylyltransferase [Longimicrobium sp.]
MPGAADALGAILAGGASRRFGAPKALATVGGRRVVDRVYDALAAVTGAPVLIANEPALFPDFAELRADEVGGVGPLAGIATALRWAAERGAGGALCVACDMPFVPPELLRRILARADDGDAVLPESGGRRGVEPLCAWYSTNALPAIDRMMSEGEHALYRLADRVRAVRLALAQVEECGDPSVLFLNINTPEDHQRAERIAGG